MDDRRFDDLTRRLARGHTRRSVLRGLVGGGAAVLATGAGSALAKPNPEKKVAICHFDADTGLYHEISISRNALDAHLQQHPEDSEGTCSCTPLTCAELGCGQQPDGCGATINCGCCTDADCGTNTGCITHRCTNQGFCIQGTQDPVDCAVGDWSPAGECSETCGGGTQTWTRPVVTQPSCGGAECPPLSEERECNTEVCCDPIPCADGACGDQLDSCGNIIGYCSAVIPCPAGFCGGQYDTCGHLVGDCGHSHQTCPDNFCGELKDDCGNVIDTCMNMSLQCPDVPHCGILEDACGNQIRGCGDPHPAPCGPNDCGFHADACNVWQGDFCYDACTCIPIGGACTPGPFPNCCGFDTGGVGACNTWSHCPQGTTCC